MTVQSDEVGFDPTFSKLRDHSIKGRDRRRGSSVIRHSYRASGYLGLATRRFANVPIASTAGDFGSRSIGDVPLRSASMTTLSTGTVTTSLLGNAVRTRDSSSLLATLLATTVVRPWLRSSATKTALSPTSIERGVGSTITNVESTDASGNRVRVPIPASRSATMIVSDSGTELSNCSADNPHHGQSGSGLSIRLTTVRRTPSGASVPYAARMSSQV